MALSYIGGENAQVEVGVPQGVTGLFQGLLLFFLLASDFLVRYRVSFRRAAPGGRRSMNLEVAVPVLLTIISAATPLLLAGIGELVVERSGVLNLGVEGMMLAGAVTAFAVTFTTGSYTPGILAAALAGMALALIFGVLTLTLVSNQVATGLALTLFGLGLSALIGAGFVGSPIAPLPKLAIPGLATIPVLGPILFDQDALVYLSVALTIGVAWFLKRTRGGMILRACGDSDVSAHSIGYDVIRIRYFAVAVRRRVRGSGWRVPVARLHADVGREHDRRARLDRAGAGRVRLLAALAAARRRLPFRRRHHPAALCPGHGRDRRAGAGMSMLPYLATIVVLTIISAGSVRGGSTRRPASASRSGRRLDHKLITEGEQRHDAADSGAGASCSAPPPPAWASPRGRAPAFAAQGRSRSASSMSAPPATMAGPIATTSAARRSRRRFPAR